MTLLFSEMTKIKCSHFDQFYQEKRYWASDKVLILSPEDSLDHHILNFQFLFGGDSCYYDYVVYG